jgi:diguanylate cyclase (GGDEF)-like protein
MRENRRRGKQPDMGKRAASAAGSTGHAESSVVGVKRFRNPLFNFWDHRYFLNEPVLARAEPNNLMSNPEISMSNVPEDIYRAQVEAMFSDFHSVWIGAFAGALATLVVSFECANVDFALISLSMAVLGLLRCALMSAYIRRRPFIVGRKAQRRWEILYVIGASGYVGLLGLASILSFTAAGDEFARILNLTGLAFFLMGIPGRNFASNLLVNVLLAVSSISIFSALGLGGRYYWLLGLLVVLPSFVAMRRISIRLRGVYLDALVKARYVSVLVDRFDTALNNMPYGLAMLDAAGGVVVTNQRLADLLKLGGNVKEKNTTLDKLLRQSAEAGCVLENEINGVLSGLQIRSTGKAFEELLLHTTNGRTLNLTLQPMANGGAVVLFEDVTERKITQARINELARFDPLTGLPNRTEFRELAEGVLGSMPPSLPCAVMFVDLDHFKQVNDTLGHAVGDKLLGAVAERLLFATSQGDLVARFGGDEFVVLLKDVTDRAYVAGVARGIIEKLSNPYQIGDHLIGSGASIGIALASPDCADIGSLLRNADMALYQSKAEGRGTWRFFELEMEVKAQSRRNLEFDLRRALDNDEFELYFQPIYNLEKKRFSGCEALIRWNHPTRGRVPPAVFVPVAEEMGLILRLDEWVLKSACKACATWPSDTRVAVNVSALHFRDRQVVEAVKAALDASQLTPHRLEVELTETALLQNIQKTRAVLTELRQLGVRISLDDFGTGYSSLSYLSSLPFNKIKIDRSFLQGLERDGRALRLLSGISRLSADLGMLVVMEGVETEDELSLITGYTAVDEIQGYLFSKPIPMREIFELFSERKLSAA